MKFLHLSEVSNDDVNEQSTNQIKIQIVIIEVNKFDNATVVEHSENFGFQGHLSACVIVRPTVCWYFILCDELNGNVIVIETIPRSHDKPVAA
jgi:hypothetical protein